MTKPTFDMEAAIEALRAGKDLTGKDGILTPLIKQLTEAALNVELDQKHTKHPKHFLSRKEARCRGQSLISNDRKDLAVLSFPFPTTQC